MTFQNPLHALANPRRISVGQDAPATSREEGRPTWLYWLLGVGVVGGVAVLAYNEYDLGAEKRRVTRAPTGLRQENDRWLSRVERDPEALSEAHALRLTPRQYAHYLGNSHDWNAQKSVTPGSARAREMEARAIERARRS